jgi:hypothetical protein
MADEDGGAGEGESPHFDPIEAAEVRNVFSAFSYASDALTDKTL